VRLRDGRLVEERQPHLRGGAHEPMSAAELDEKFLGNAAHGGWREDRAREGLRVLRRLYDGDVDLSIFREEA
jgi:hypothetical protein